MRRLQTSCDCGEGLDYGCDQSACGPDAKCDAGHCIQDGLIRPTCIGGDCSQADAINATCGPYNNCCPPLGNCDVVSTGECIGEEMRVFSCTHNKFMALGDINVGDSIRSMDSNGPMCSDVYYVFHHKLEAPAYAIEVSGLKGEEKIILSANHLLYVGNDYSNRRAVLAKNVAIGDILVSSDGKSSRKVLSVETTLSRLVNVLTYEPSIELEGGVLISAHSFHETIYSYIFWPFALAHKYLGISPGESTQSVLQSIQGLGIVQVGISYLSS